MIEVNIRSRFGAYARSGPRTLQPAYRERQLSFDGEKPAIFAVYDCRIRYACAFPSFARGSASGRIRSIAAVASQRARIR